jgi:hypothetical protein
MGYGTEAILRDLNGDPIPQYFHVGDDEFKALTEEEAEEMAVFLEAIKDALEGDVQTALDDILTATEATQTALEGNIQTSLDDIQTAVEMLPANAIAEYTWDAGDADPAPAATVRAFGIKHDAGEFTAYYWDGASWGAI